MCYLSWFSFAHRLAIISKTNCKQHQNIPQNASFHDTISVTLPHEIMHFTFPCDLHQIFSQAFRENRAIGNLIQPKNNSDVSFLISHTDSRALRHVFVCFLSAIYAEATHHSLAQPANVESCKESDPQLYDSQRDRTTSKHTNVYPSEYNEKQTQYRAYLVAVRV